MVQGFEPDALLGRVYTLEDGAPVRLRLARPSDAGAIRRLLEACGVRAHDIELARLVHFDPRRRYVLCAAGLVGCTESVLGLGAIRLEGAAEPELVLLADDSPPEVGDLLTQALIAAARRRGRSRAA